MGKIRIAKFWGITWHAAAGCLLALMAMACAACSTAAPEQALRASVAGLQEAMEVRDASAVEDYLADDFVGPDGLDRAGARRMATLYLMRHERIGTTLGPLDVQLNEDHATIRFTAAFTGGSTGRLPESGRIYAVVTGWRLMRGEWKLTSASWESEL